MTFSADVREVADRIGIPVGEWSGNCHGVATAMVDRGVVEGRAVYGHWRGPVSPSCTVPQWILLARFPGWVRHGWISAPGGRVVDPTRWAFEAVAPYVFEGPASAEYDEGGVVWRRAIRRPCPPHSGAARRYAWSDVLPDPVLREAAIAMLSAPDGAAVTTPELMWLASLSPEELGGLAGPLYEGLHRNQMGGFVPIDNLRRILRGAP